MSTRARSLAWSAARCWAGLAEDEASLRASSLAFSVISCAAPLGAMIISLAALSPQAFSFLPSLYEILGSRVLPRALEEAAAAMSTFAVNAGHLSLASLALSLVGSLFLSMQIERCSLACWGLVPDPDSSAGSLARHFCALLLAPAAMVVLGWAAVGSLELTHGIGSGFVSPLLLFFFFLLASWALPGRRPALRVACAACALASVECVVLQAGFGWVWSFSRSYGAIYGAAAVFMGALLWIWLFWLSYLSSLSICSTIMLGRVRDPRVQGLAWTLRWAPEVAVNEDARDVMPPRGVSGALAKPVDPDTIVDPLQPPSP